MPCFFCSGYAMRRTVSRLRTTRNSVQSKPSTQPWIVFPVSGRHAGARLLRAFGSMKGVEQASLDELMQIPSMNEKLAQQLWQTISSGSASAVKADRWRQLLINSRQRSPELLSLQLGCLR